MIWGIVRDNASCQGSDLLSATLLRYDEVTPFRSVKLLELPFIPTMTNRYRRTREDHSRELAEDYVELIDTLIKEKGEARVVDLADRLGVSHVTVSRTIQRLVRDGLVSSEPYRSVFLTDQGRAVAQASLERHQLVVAFLLSVGVPPEVAETDAEGIEHHASQETLAAMRDFLIDRQG